MNIVKKLNKRMRRVQLPKDEELFPELFNGTAKSGLWKEFEELIGPCTETDNIPQSLRKGKYGLDTQILAYIGEEVDCELEKNLLQCGARTDVPDKEYLAFGLEVAPVDEHSVEHIGCDLVYNYFDRDATIIEDELNTRDNAHRLEIHTLNVVEDVFGGYARRQLNYLDGLSETLAVKRPWYILLLIPIFLAGIYELLCMLFPSWPNFQNIMGLAAIVISALTLFIFGISVQLYWEEGRATFKRYKREGIPVEEIMIGIHRSIRYRRILLNRMGMKSQALDIQEKRFQRLRENGL